MRISGSTQTSQTSSSSSSSSSSPSSSTTTTSSLHSTISTHSLTSSTSSSSSLLPSSPPRCPGLDLLVKAVYHVSSGSAVAFPYIQRRVIRRRKPASRFSHFIPPQFILDHHRHCHDHEQHDDDDDDDDLNCRGDTNVLVVGDGDHKVVTNNSKNKKKQRRRSSTEAAPSKYGGSVFRSLKPKRRRSTKV